MIKTFNDLDDRERQALVSRIDEVLGVEFGLSRPAITAFWSIIGVGICKTEVI